MVNRNTRYVILVDVIRVLVCFGGCIGVPVRHEV